MRTLAMLPALAGLTALSLSSGALAHATLEVHEARAGAYYKAVMRVPHGCDGSPTIAVRVQIPDGVTAVKPQPKPGWELTTVRGPLESPYDDGHGNLVTEGVTEVAWTGGRLLDEHYDEFVMRVRLPDRAGTTLHFPTVQECEDGVHRWIEIPEPGRSRADYAEPAPQVTLTGGN
jgi:uncharacterized protein YcnI